MKMPGQGAYSPPDDGTPVELCVSVPASPEAGTVLRRAVRSLEQFFGPDKAEQVELLVTELATNGVKYAAAQGANRITLDAQIDSTRLYVGVTDRGAGFEASAAARSRTEPGGWGLMLVQGIADRWGVDREPSTRVWFELGRGAMAA